MTKFFATCPKGTENLLRHELESLGAENCRETAAGVYFEGIDTLGYRVCLWTRLANRVLLPIAKCEVESPEDIYASIVNLQWENYFSENSSFVVEFSGQNSAVRHTQYGAQVVKDAVVDRLRQQTGMRPSVNKSAPDITINVRLAKGKRRRKSTDVPGASNRESGSMLHVSLDLGGESLHRRGYRVGQGGAPLKENLAAALLVRAGWSEICQRQIKSLTERANTSEGFALVDPMCGSGTLLIEGALIAADVAPGLVRKQVGRHFGFEHWKSFDEASWSALLAEASTRAEKGLALANTYLEVRGYDIDPKVLDAAELNIQEFGLEKLIRVARKPVAEFKKPTHKTLTSGLFICNPPYGERLGEIQALESDYRTLGRVAKAELPGWKMAVFTGNSDLGKALRLRAMRKYKFFNGTIPSELLLFELLAEGEATLRNDNDDIKERDSTGLSDGAQMIANRLRKNRKRLTKWIQGENVECFRLYDADMPEYSAAVDVYCGRVHVQEYAAPKTINPNAAERRFGELLTAVAEVFDIPVTELHTKTRRRNRGKNQYEKLSDADQGRHDTHFDRNAFVVSEGKARLYVNLVDYLDTGLFLDHRPLRKRIHDVSLNKDFLNLFSYTATASVMAALGGAKSTMSVDMSNTYLSWAKKNFELNNMDSRRHELVRQDCRQWLKDCRQGFDIIMLDPPTFSNSKRMEGVLDIQRDHVSLIKRCMELLKPGGVLYFSNNLRSFKLDSEALKAYSFIDITASTLDHDFKQNPKIHQCWEITWP